ncbi:MAG TPA: hypothetical protein VFI47_10640, partial [Acidimicrobiales bacterium]|nr:hypothetical protein [Acidimicrobiales bacterium]
PDYGGGDPYDPGYDGDDPYDPDYGGGDPYDPGYDDWGWGEPWCCGGGSAGDGGAGGYDEIFWIEEEFAA